MYNSALTGSAGSVYITHFTYYFSPYPLTSYGESVGYMAERLAETYNKGRVNLVLVTYRTLWLARM